jgi:methionyl-tRNA formyltransferase
MTANFKSILFLGYDNKRTKLIGELEKAGHSVTHQENYIDTLEGYDLAVAFGYRYKIRKELIQTAQIPIINLHISYLPWNKGAHPNFWAFWDNTPSGVTIHEIDQNFDTGPIIFQEMVEFDIEKETFATSYNKLIAAIENLFIKNMTTIISKNYTKHIQRGRGTIHSVNQLPAEFSGWDANISKEITRLENAGFNPQQTKLDLIDKIEKVRTTNNINWMNLLRVVAEVAPEKLSEITTKIKESDDLISSYFKQLGD